MAHACNPITWKLRTEDLLGVQVDNIVCLKTVWATRRPYLRTPTAKSLD